MGISHIMRYFEFLFGTFVKVSHENYCSIFVDHVLHVMEKYNTTLQSIKRGRKNSQRKFE